MLPIKLRLKNFFSHKNSEVDFSQFNSALLIGNVEGDYGVSNGSGKSAIFEAILWCLFNKSRAATMDDIVMWGENDCSVDLIFSHKGVRYRITRTRSRVTSTSTVSFESEGEDGEWVDLSGSTARLTNDEIIKHIRFDYKTFVNSAYFRQNDISEFAEADPSKKKEILKSIIDISKWDEYEKKAKGKLKETNAECKILSRICEGYDELVESLASDEQELKELNRRADVDTKKQKVLGERIAKISSEYSELKKNLDTDQWDRVMGEIEKHKASLTKKVSSLKTLSAEVEKHEEKIFSLKNKVEDINRKVESVEVIEDDQKMQNDYRDEMVKYRSSLTSAEDAIRKLSKRKISHGTCYACGQEVGDELYDKLLHGHESEIEEYEKQIVYSKNKINELKAKIEEVEESIKNRRLRDSLLATARSSLAELDISQDHLKKLKSDKNEIELEIKTLQDKIQLNNKVIESLRNDDFKELRESLSKLKEEKAELDSEIQMLHREVGVYTERVSNSKEKVKGMEASKKELMVKTDRSSYLSKLAKMFGKNGIQTILLNAVIEDLEKTSNKILHTICNEPFTILLETQRVGSDGISIIDTLDLVVSKDGVKQNFKSLSGGEQFRVSLALRIALSEISSRHGGSSLEFLLLDEVSSPLDRQGTETLFVNVIKSLEKKYKIMVITHNDTIKEKFDNVIDVSKIDGESQVNFVAR